MPDVYKSECGRYLCRAPRMWGSFEVWTVDGATHWRDDNRIKSWSDHELEWHPFEYCTGGYSARTTGQKKGSFTVTLLHCDPTKVLQPWTGNTVIEKSDVVFRRKVPHQNWPKFLRRPRLNDDPLGRFADDGGRV